MDTDSLYRMSPSIVLYIYGQEQSLRKSFAFSPLNLSNPQIFWIVKYAKVTEVNC